MCLNNISHVQSVKEPPNIFKRLLRSCVVFELATLKNWNTFKWTSRVFEVDHSFQLIKKNIKFRNKLGFPWNVLSCLWVNEWASTWTHLNWHVMQINPWSGKRLLMNTLMRAELKQPWCWIGYVLCNVWINWKKESLEVHVRNSCLLMSENA